MSLRATSLCLLASLLVMVAGVSVARAEAPAAAVDQAGAADFQKGEDLLKKADFDGAKAAFAAAAKANRENKAYATQYLVLTRVLKTREALATEQNAEKWRQMAMGLRNFYYGNGLFEEMLKLAQQMYDRQKDVKTASYLADANLQLDKNAEAEAVLTAVPEKDLTVEAKVMLGIALARQKKLDAAKPLADKAELPEGCSAGYMFYVARLKALVGDDKGAAAVLTQAFEATPATRLDSFKTYAKANKDLAGIAASDAFALALKAESKVKESSCSGGSSCDSCASKNTCSSAKPAE